MIQSLLFIFVAIGTFVLAYPRYRAIWDNVHLGKDEEISGDVGVRLKNVLLVAFGQKKMFKRFIPAILHFFIYAAFLFTQIELIEIFIDGIFGKHRFFAQYLGPIYTGGIGLVEILSALAFFATLIFIVRRVVIKVPRFHKPEMEGWPFKDALIILFGEIVLLIGVFSMNGADVVLQQLDPVHYIDTGRLPISSFLGPALFGGLSEGALHIVERFGWWLHILVVFGFILYLPISKHLHIFLAFPNIFYSRLRSRGEISNMPEIMNEVKSMLGLVEGGEEAPMDAELPEFGSKDIFDLSWKNIMDAYSCTECGRCTSVCPANLTGKKLSPRKVMMDIRDRADEVGRNIKANKTEFIKADKKESETTLTKSNYDDGKSLFDFISREELHACTTCNACVEACPVMIDPLEPILQMRRYEILTESAGPSDWLPMFTSLENTGAVWQVPAEREDWIK